MRGTTRRGRTSTSAGQAARSSRIGVGVVRTSGEERLEVDDREGQSGGVEHCDQAHVCPTSSEAMEQDPPCRLTSNAANRCFIV